MDMKQITWSHNFLASPNQSIKFPLLLTTFLSKWAITQRQTLHLSCRDIHTLAFTLSIQTLNFNHQQNGREGYGELSRTWHSQEHKERWSNCTWQATVTGRVAQSLSPTRGQSPGSGVWPSPDCSSPTRTPRLSTVCTTPKIASEQNHKRKYQVPFLDQPTSFIFWSMHTTWISERPRRSSRHLWIAN